MVPFLDLKVQHKLLEAELIEVFRDCLRNASFVGGPKVQTFEEEFAQFCETKYCVGVNSGTDALRFALIAAGIGPGDEVITVPNTFIATTEAISQAGATIAFVDIDERTYNMDPNKLEDYLKRRIQDSGARRQDPDSRSLQPGAWNLKPAGPALKPETWNLEPGRTRVRAIIPVHLYGQPADMDAILEIAQKYELIVIEDACQAHGAEYFSKKENRWKKAGSMGLAAAFSFYPGKNLGACGEGGAVTTSNEEIAQKIRMLRDHGQAKKYYHDMEGYNGRLDAIQAGILRIKLRHVPDWNEKRRKNAALYSRLFWEQFNPEPATRNAELVTRNSEPATQRTGCRESGLGGSESLKPETWNLKPEGTVIPPYVPSWANPVFHLYIVRVSKRDELQKYLSERDIATGLHYPIPLHLQKAYLNDGYKQGLFPVSEKVALEILSLPMFPELSEEQIEYVATEIKKFYN